MAARAAFLHEGLRAKLFVGVLGRHTIPLGAPFALFFFMAVRFLGVLIVGLWRDVFAPLVGRGLTSCFFLAPFKLEGITLTLEER